MRRLGGNRAGEIRISRFLRNCAVSIEEMVASAAARTAARVAGRHVLAIQDTTFVRADKAGRSLALHPVIAVDAAEGTLLGLVDARFFAHAGGERAGRRQKSFAAKEGRRWLEGAQSAAALKGCGAACITIVADREGDIYEDFALRPAAVEVLIRAGQDRRLADGSRLFACAKTLVEAARLSVDLPAAPGRRARLATIALRFARVDIACPANRQAAELKALPPSVALSFVEAKEVNAPDGVAPIHWRLLTSHAVADAEAARRIVGFYRQRWTIEQLFRTLKSKGFDIEALRIADGGPFEKLLAACLIAAITVLQLVRERDGVARRPLDDAFDAADQPIIEAVSASLEGKTARQKNPHPRGSLAYAAWVLARLGGWTGYYGKPGPVVMLAGLTQVHAIKHGWSLRNV